jgi:hypothetical protein
MRPEFCPDCNHDRTPDEAEVLSFTPDRGWAAEFAMPMDEGEPLYGLSEMRGPDGRRWGTWTVPVIGWAVVRKHYEGLTESGHESRVEAVLLSEGEYPVPMSEYRADHNMQGVHTRITRDLPRIRQGLVPIAGGAA